MKICAVDIGTSRIKAALFTERGKMTFLASKRLPRAASPDTQRAEEWYICTAELLKQVTEEALPEAVVLTGNMHALLGVDKEGKSVEDAFLWSDQSSMKESDELNRLYKEALLQDFCNSSIPVFTLPKILKMKRERESLYNRTEKFLQSKDYILYHLTGNFVTDPTDASGTLLMQYDNKCWSETFCNTLDIDKAKLPDILPSAAICGYVTKEAASVTGLRAGTPVVTGCGDLASAALGSGVDQETFSLTLGTAGQLLASGKDYRKNLAGKVFIFAHADPEQELYLGSVPSGGFTFEYLAALHNISVEEFFHQAQSIPLSEDLPLFLPYILGKGAPYMDYESNGAWFKLSANHRLKHLCRSAIFGVLACLHQNSELLRSLGLPGEKLVLQALANREPAVRETANILFPQKKFLAENSEASLLGAAILGYTALKVYPDLASGVANMIKYSPVAPPALQEKAVGEALYEKIRKYREVL